MLSIGRGASSPKFTVLSAIAAIILLAISACLSFFDCPSSALGFTPPRVRVDRGAAALISDLGSLTGRIGPAIF